MPELHFSVRWPDGSAVRYYSPSTIIRAHLREGASYSILEFVAHVREALLIASERVRGKYGYACSSAMDTLRQIEETAERFAAEATPGRVEVTALDGPPLTR
jgi:uncharacterized repeat protein (TIGR04042 family)